MFNIFLAQNQPDDAGGYQFLPKGDPATFSFGDIVGKLGRAEDLLLTLAIMAVFLLLLWSGIMYLTAYGSEEKALKAKNTFYWSILGMIVILLSKLAIAKIIGAFSATGGPPTAPDWLKPPGE